MSKEDEEKCRDECKQRKRNDFGKEIRPSFQGSHVKCLKSVFCFLEKNEGANEHNADECRVEEQVQCLELQGVHRGDRNKSRIINKDA